MKNLNEKIIKRNEVLKFDVSNKYQIYSKYFGKHSKNSYKKIDELILYENLGKKDGVISKLKDILNDNPFNYKLNNKNFRDNIDYKLNRDAANLSLQLNKNFFAYKDGKKNNNLETSIQRHIYNISKNSKGYKCLGKIIGYENPCYNNGSSRRAAVDLISITDDNNINLIELKICETDKSKDSKEFLLRAIFEICTYSSYLEHNKKEFIKQINSNLKLQLDESQQIKKVILAPLSMYESYNEEVCDTLNEIIKVFDIKCFVIKTKNNITLSNEKVGDNRELFDIEELKGEIKLIED